MIFTLAAWLLTIHSISIQSQWWGKRSVVDCDSRLRLRWSDLGSGGTLQIRSVRALCRLNFLPCRWGLLKQLTVTWFATFPSLTLRRSLLWNSFQGFDAYRCLSWPTKFRCGRTLSWSMLVMRFKSSWTSCWDSLMILWGFCHSNAGRSVMRSATVTSEWGAERRVLCQEDGHRPEDVVSLFLQSTTEDQD